MRKKKILLALAIILFGSISRIFLNKVIGIPNFEAVTSLSLISGSLLGSYFAFFIPLFTIFLSDIFFKNTAVYLFTWSAFIIIGLLGSKIKKGKDNYFLKITFSGIISVIFFYLWTNFGWWLTSDMYEMTTKGLLDCYIAGIPFLKNQLLSVLLFTPSFAVLLSLILDLFLEENAIVSKEMVV